MGEKRLGHLTKADTQMARSQMFTGVSLLLLLLSHFSRVRLCATPQMAAHQAPPPLGFSRQEHWSGLPCPPPEDLPNPGIESRSPALLADSEPPGKLVHHYTFVQTHRLCNIKSEL